MWLWAEYWIQPETGQGSGLIQIGGSSVRWASDAQIDGSVLEYIILRSVSIHNLGQLTSKLCGYVAECVVWSRLCVGGRKAGGVFLAYAGFQRDQVTVDSGCHT